MQALLQRGELSTPLEPRGLFQLQLGLASSPVGLRRYLVLGRRTRVLNAFHLDTDASDNFDGDNARDHTCLFEMEYV